MKILLINPPSQGSRTAGINGIIDTLFYNSPPLGLGFLAAVLEREGHEVAIVDAPVERKLVRDLVRQAREQRPDLVGFTATTTYLSSALETVRGIRAALPGARICMGGPHFTGHPELLLDNPELDFGVRGEGELTLREAVAAIEAGEPVDDIPGVAVARDGALHLAPPRPLIEDLDSLPMPARHLMPLQRYRPLPNDQRRLPKTSLIMSRGCPFQCIFCDKTTFGASYRAFGPERVVEEMAHVVDRYGVRDIAFVDSTFTPYPGRIDRVLDAMEANPVPVSWTASCRANLLDREILRRMRDAGCWRIRIAIESGNDDILRTIRKGVTRQQFEHTVRTAAELGLSVKGFFMVGHIGETAASMQESIDFACSLPLDDVTVQINTPLPGTPQHAICKDHGTLVERGPESFTFFEPVFVPHGLTAEQLLAAHRHFYRSFYLRPRTARRLARDFRSPSDLRKWLRAVPAAVSLMLTNRGR
jgi:anaerobic magnesium-protoporphyrin IX monomethyl ester cyclase